MDILPNLKQTVQNNCHIADSLHAGDYTLCVYLLKMREFYRWEKGLPYDSPLPRDELGNWLTERELLWESLSEMDFTSYDVDGEMLSPFETDKINARINDFGLIYSGGLGGHSRPHFFLGELLAKRSYEEYTILVSGKEYARDLTAPPAMALNNNIFIRKESLGRMLWEKLEEWRWNRSKGAMAKALSFYDFDKDLDAGLEAMTENELHSVILHEIGEIQAGELLGDDWHRMLHSLPRSPAEIMARAVRDHIADCLSTLPELIQEKSDASLYFYFGNFKAMRKELYPSLMKAFQEWNENGKLSRLREWVDRGRDHWQNVALKILEIYRNHGRDSGDEIIRLVENSKL